MLLSILQERLTTEVSCFQPNSIAPNLVFHCSQFPWSCENKVREKSQAKSLLPVVGLEGNTECEESVHCSIYGCGNGRAQGLAQQPAFLLGFMSARPLHLMWGLPGREISESSVGCVCVRTLTGNSQTIPSKQSQPHRAGVILIDSSSLLSWFLLYKWICCVRWLVHLVQQPCLNILSVVTAAWIFRFG